MNKRIKNELIDFIITSDTVGFLISRNENTKYDYDLVRFNPQTGESKKLLKYNSYSAGGLGDLVYYKNSVLLNTQTGFLISNDLGTKWTFISNTCSHIEKNYTIYTWRKGVLTKVPYTELFQPLQYTQDDCDNNYYFKHCSLMVTEDNKLKIIYTYDTDTYPFLMFSELNFINIE